MKTGKILTTIVAVFSMLAAWAAEPGAVMKASDNSRLNAIANRPVALSDFLTANLTSLKDIRVIFQDLKNQGFTHSEDEFGYDIFKRGNIEIKYVEDFDDDGEGFRCFSIHFPNSEETFNFLMPIQNNRNWKMESAQMGSIYKHGSISINQEIYFNNVRIIASY